MQIIASQLIIAMAKYNRQEDCADGTLFKIMSAIE
jgi:hypothetical protein